MELIWERAKALVKRVVRVIYHFNDKKSIVTIPGVFRAAYQGYKKRLDNVKLP